MTNVDTFMDQLTADFCRGYMSRVAECFDYPAAIYLEDETCIVADEETCMALYGDCQAKLSERGLDHIETQVLARALSRGDQFAVTVTHSYRNAAACEMDRAQVRYFIEYRDGEPKIRLAEYQTPPQWTESMTSGNKGLH